MKRSFKVDMTIKENGGVFTPLVDRFKSITPEMAIKVLESKYTSKKLSFYDKMGKAMEVAIDEFDKFLMEDDKDAPNNSNRKS